MSNNNNPTLKETVHAIEALQHVYDKTFEMKLDTNMDGVVLEKATRKLVSYRLNMVETLDQLISYVKFLVPDGPRRN